MTALSFPLTINVPLDVEQRNLLHRSGFFNGAQPGGWWCSGSLEKVGAFADDAAPEVGAIVADETTDDGEHSMGVSLPVGVLEEGETYYLTYVVKALANSFIFIRTNANEVGTSERSYFDVANGAIGSIHPNHSAPSIMHLGNNVYRIGVRYTPTALDIALQREVIVGTTQADGSNSYVGTPGVQTAVFFHGQIEKGSFPTLPEVVSPSV